MWSWINAVVDLAAGHPAWALVIAFLAAVIEAVAVLGIVIPGTPILMAVAGASAMAGQPVFPFVCVAVVGAVIGDTASYLIGQRYSGHLIRMWPFSRRPELLRSATHFFHRYGVASVAFCRFLPVLRSTVPLVAGMTAMPSRQFIPANVASALVWAPLHIYSAQLAGLSLGSLEQGDWQTAALWGAVFLGCIAAGWGVHRLTR